MNMFSEDTINLIYLFCTVDTTFKTLRFYS